MRPIVHLHVERELFLRFEVELDHGVGQRVGVGLQVWHESQHCPTESSVDLLQRSLAGVIHVDYRDVSQESKDLNEKIKI